MAIGQYMGNLRARDYDCLLLCETMLIIGILPLWWWCMS